MSNTYRGNAMVGVSFNSQYHSLKIYSKQNTLILFIYALLN